MSDYTALTREQLRDLHLRAQDDLATVKRSLPSYDDLRAAATNVLELRCELERRMYGKVKLNRRATLAALMR